jgi:GTP-binding protein
MKKRVPIVAIVGRTNVGKSSLYNYILKTRHAIVAREPGTTRDSLMSKSNYDGHDFWLVDTAGFKNPEDDFEETIQEQIYQAAENADVIWVMTEADVPINDDDRKIVAIALKSKKPTYLIINKIDKLKKAKINHIDKVGIKEFIPISVSQGKGIEQLLDKLVSVIPKIESKPTNTKSLKLAIIGRPNVGKSSLFNTLANKQQAIVADRAGTTRDLNKTTVKYHEKEIELIDTAGIRRSGKITVGVEKFSVLRAISAIEQSDVCLLLMDCNELNVQLDQKLAGLIEEAGKGLILVISKWDSVEDKSPYTRDDMAKQIAVGFDFVAWAPLIFTSSVTGQNVTKIYDIALEITANRAKKISTNELNEWLHKTVSRHPPAGIKNFMPKLNYIVQETDNDLPAFKIFGSQARAVHWSYKRYLERQLREAFGFEGSPIEIWFTDNKESPGKDKT